MKYKTLLLVILLNLSLFSIHGPSMSVNLQNGSQSTYNLHSVINMTFTSGNFSVKTQSLTNSYLLTDFKNLRFSPGVYTANMNVINENLIRVFPNPVKNNLFVNLNGLIADGATLSVFSIDGKLMKFQSILNPSITLDLSDLSTGFYFCSYFNGSEIKTLKIIKE